MLITNVVVFNGQGKNADLLSCYFGENPKNCTFEQGLEQDINLILLCALH